MSAQYQQTVADEEEWRAEMEGKFPSLKSWPGKSGGIMENNGIYSAFIKAQTSFAPALKTSTNPHFKSKYVDLSACVEAVIDALHSNGIGLIQKTHPDETGVTVETVFVHTSGESMSGGSLHVPAAKNDPQGYGSALTYCRRYSLMAACGIAPEDDDGNAASKPKSAVIPARPPTAELGLTEGQIEALNDLAMEVQGLLREGKPAAADAAIRKQNLESEQEIALANMLDSKARAAIKEARKAWRNAPVTA